MHHALVYVLLLNMLIGYVDIRYFKMCPWVEEKSISFWTAFKLTILTVRNTFLTGLLMHVACGYKITRSFLERRQVWLICAVTIGQYMIDFTSQIIWLNKTQHVIRWLTLLKMDFNATVATIVAYQTCKNWKYMSKR